MTKWILAFYPCLYLILHTGTASAQPVQPDARDNARFWLERRGEVILYFKTTPEVSFDQINAFLSVSRFRNDTITAYANAAGFAWFQKLNIPYGVLDPPSLKPGVLVTRKKEEVDWRTRYPTYPDYLELLEKFAGDHPGLCRLVQFGTTVNGRKMLALKISDNPDLHEKEPVVLYTSTMHGDEVLGYMMMLRLVDCLLSEYETDPQVRYLVENVEIWINPLANPDGSYFISDSSVAGATRFNANHQDLNRDFPSPGIGNPEGDSREPETLAMMRFMEDIHVVLAANFHGGASLVNYPWDTWKRLHADDTWYWFISRGYADTVHVYSPDGYMTDFDNGITNGFAWYRVIGGRQDYTNYFLHAREVTIELDEDMMPPESSLDDYWHYNRQSLLQYIERSLSGISGEIADSVTGQPVRAEIWIENHDYDSSFVYSDPSSGAYYRLLTGDHYNIKVVAPGYVVQKKLARVTEGELAIHNFRLAPVELHFLYPNPFSHFLHMITDQAGGELVLEFLDLTGREVAFIRHRVSYTGRQIMDTGNIPAGTYLVRALYGDQIVRQVLIKMAD